MNKRLLFIIAGILPFCLQAQAQCPLHSPVTSIDYEVRSTEYIRDYSVEDLTSMHGPDGMIARGNIMGLAGGEIEMRFNATFEAVPYNDQPNHYCLNVKTVRATINSKPKVYIAKNFSRGTCEYAATLKHELKHVKVLKRAHKEALPAFRKHLNESTKSLPVLAPMRISNVNEGKQNLISHLKNELQSYIKLIEQDVELRQREIDSQEEYDQVWQRCDKWNRK